MKYERLTDKKHRYKKCASCTYRNCQYCDDDIEYENEAYNRLAELEDKLEQGTLIELPCKVGDTVYVIIKAENGYALLKDICDGFMIKDGEVYIGLQTYNVGANKYYFSREEAEKRLKELQE